MKWSENNENRPTSFHWAYGSLLVLLYHKLWNLVFHHIMQGANKEKKWIAANLTVPPQPTSSVYPHSLLSPAYNSVIENTWWVSFDIRFTRQCFENACWYREACRAIQHAFSKPSLVNLISKDTHQVFYLSVYPLLNPLQISDYDVIFHFCVDSASLATSFKECNVIMTW